MNDGFYLLYMPGFDPNAGTAELPTVAIGYGADFMEDSTTLLECVSAHEHGSNPMIQTSDQVARITYHSWTDTRIPSPDTEFVHLACLFEDLENALVPVNAIDNLYHPTCGGTRTFGPSHDLTSVECDLPPGHVVDHEGFFLPDTRISWSIQRRS